jgi:transglutaminase-like putative cysteine protease
MWDRLKLQEGWLSLFLLYVMLIGAAFSISAAGWTEGLGHLATVALLSITAGAMLSKSRFPALMAHLFSLVYGLFTVGYIIGRMIELPTWPERVNDLAERAVTWLTKATSGGTSGDSLMFVLLLACLFWFLGHIAAWYTLRRSRSWRVLLPIGLTMLVNYYVYTDPRISTRSTSSLAPFVVIFLLAALLYLVRINVYLRELEWQDSQVSYNTELRFDFVRAGLVLAAVALVVMLIAPGAQAGPQMDTMWGGIEDMRTSVRETANRLFASLDTYGRGLANPFGGRLVLGGPRDLGNVVLFDVNAPGNRRYWIGASYDRYTGSDWISSDDKTARLQPDYLLDPHAGLARREITQTVTVYLQSSTQLFAAPTPVRVPELNTRAKVSFDRGQMTTASILHSVKTLKAGNSYRIVSAVSVADPDTLRAAGQDYPEWITRRYLQLPETVTDRTRALALEITSGHDNTFDKAQAIEEYLRLNFHYDLNSPRQPEGQDFVDFALFDLQGGYCDYYASSFVVLARSVGIPSRLAVGYAQGEYNEEAGAYRVYTSNGHSWPEIYLPDYGWLQFEPTVVIDPINWPAPPPPPGEGADSLASRFGDQMDDFDPRDMLADEPNMRPGGPFDSPQVESPPRQTPWALLLLGGLLLVVCVSLVGTYWTIERRGLGGLNLVERAYARMWRFAARLGVPSPPDQTPYERAGALTILVPEGETAITRITDMYIVERFGQGKGGGDDDHIEEEWTLLRPVLWKSWLQKKFSRFQQQEQQRRWQQFSEAAAPPKPRPPWKT